MAVTGSLHTDYALQRQIDEKVNSSMMLKCAIDGIPASDNLWNKDDVTTGLLYKNGTIYTGGSYDNLRYNTKPISVSENDVLSFYSVGSNGSPAAQDIQYITCYDASGSINSSAGIANVLFNTYTVPSNVSSVVVSVQASVTNFMFIKNAEQTPTEYIPYQEDHFYVATAEFIPDSVRQQLVSGKQDAPTNTKGSGKVFALDTNLSPKWVDPDELIFTHNMVFGGNVTAGGGTLTLGTGANAVSITSTQLATLLSLTSASGVSF